MTHTRNLLVSATVCAVLVSTSHTAVGHAQAQHQRKALSLARPAVVEVRAAATVRVVFNSGEGSLSYGPYRVHRIGTGLAVTPDGFVITDSDLVTPAPDVPEKLLDLFFQHMVGAYEKEAGRSFSEHKRKEIIERLRQRGDITLVDSQEGLIGGVDEIPVEVRVGPSPTAGVGWGHAAEIRWVSPADRKGIAILKVEVSDLPTARLGTSVELGLQSPFTSMGFSPEEERVGHIVSYETWKDGSPVLGTDMDGPAAGPAINEIGEVVGIVASSPPESRSQGFPQVFLRPIDGIKELLRASGIDPGPGRFDGIYADAMEHFWIAMEADEEGRIGIARKEYRRTTALLGEILGASPTHLEARHHHEWANERLENLPGGMGEGFLLGATAALAFAALGILLAALVRIRRVR